ncbi:hypothetical protein GTW43_23355 [Streptomyces sp. SID5785]|uniref:hypothetical protein n=1 Tax=Streptomyces sp. SID5785 TaxID=2690309 RepID=UPI0013611B65|nr:hypothetical protein [Streptomyces sp. SID5785]MZD07995.1 hypothetical protein [Streptomyces sp. SID5785]
MIAKRRPAVAGLTMMLVAVLAACGGGSGTDGGGTSHAGGTSDSGHARPAGQAAVSGLRDGVRHQPRRTAEGTRPHYVKKCGTATKRVRHTKRSKGRTRTWYTTRTVRDCDRVRRGTETYTRVVRPERWCVRLDDVGGRTSRDDVWYRVRPADYSRVHEAADHAKVTFEPLARGC